jgi:hypothetical protein
MTIWRNHSKLIFLALALAIILVANLVIFVPRFIHQSRQLTSAELIQDKETLQSIARDGATLSQQINQHKISSIQQEKQFSKLLRQLDDMVVRLQTAPFVAPLEDRAKQTLQLAQIMSFTLRDLEVQPNSQTRDLKAASTAQVLNQAVSTAIAIK